jgi:hypothetical protein
LQQQKNTTQTTASKSPRLPQKSQSISFQSNSYFDIDAMADLSWDKRKSSKHKEESSYNDGESTDTQNS